MLLNSGVLVNHEFDANGRSAAHIAAMQGHIGVLELLLSRGTVIGLIFHSFSLMPRFSLIFFNCNEYSTVVSEYFSWSY